MSSFQSFLTRFGTTSCGLSPGAGAADGQDLRAEGVLQAAQRPQPPEDLVLVVDHHVSSSMPCDLQRVGVLAQDSGG